LMTRKLDALHCFRMGI